MDPRRDAGLPVAPPAAFDAIVLAGGTGSRLGGRDKAAVTVGGRSLLERVLDAVSAARRVVVVGPRREVARPVVWTREEPPGGGPVAAMEAALPLVHEEVVVVAATDMPFLDGTVVEALVAGIGQGDGCLLRDGEGRSQPLAAAYRAAALRGGLEALPRARGAAVKDLVAGLKLQHVDAGRAGIDCDTWDDVAAARAAVGEE